MVCHKAIMLLSLAFGVPVSVILPIVQHAERPAIAQTAQDRKAEANRFIQQGIQQSQTSQFREAFQSFEQALKIYRNIHDRQGEGWALSDLGIASQNLGNYTKAIDYQQQSLVIAQEIKNRQDEGKALGNLGMAYFPLGNYVKAVEYGQRALAIAREISDRDSEGAALGNLGVAYLNLGNYVKTIEYEQQFLLIARETHNRQSEGKALGNLGLAYKSLGNYIKAIEYQQQSLAIAREINDHQGEGKALSSLGLAYASLGSDTKAIEYGQQALAIAREIKDQQGEGAALGNLGTTYLYIGNYAKAIEHCQQHLAIAREINDRQGEGAALGNLGLAYDFLGSSAKAIEYQKQHLATAREINDRQSEGAALNNLGFNLFKSSDLIAAEKILFEGITVWESIRQTGTDNDTNKVSIFEEQARTYRTLQQVMIALKKPNAALEIAERGRARAFVELVTKRLSSSPTASAPILPPNLEQIQHIAQTQNATLVQYSIIYDSFQIQGKVQSKGSQLYIWVIHPDGKATFRSANLKSLSRNQSTSLADLVQTSREALGVRSRASAMIASIPKISPAQQTQNLRTLHKFLIEPISDLLPKNENDRVIFIPQGELFLVPFPALQDKDGKFLIEQHTILTAPSIQVLDLTRQQRKLVSGIGNALVVGNPTMPSVPFEPGDKPQRLPALPGAEKEANAIAPLLHTQALTGSQATKAAIVQQMQQADIIHLATHGLLDDQRGIGSAIALAPNPNQPVEDQFGRENGLLSAEEILDMKLKANLVVLSACDTGRGKITGDGVIGLSRSLITAGVPSVIVSLWQIPDAPTAQLMTEFYQNWRSRKLDKAQALRQAMLTILKDYRDPKDWAAFTLIGEAD